MSTTTPTRQKTAVEYLSFPARTARRVAWESWEFTVAGPYQVRVTNASYGYLKSDHAYVVGVEERDGIVVPAECACPADVHHDSACKHRVACATVAGPTVLNAAAAVENPPQSADGRAGDGGLRADSHAEERKECANGNQWCAGRDADSLPCFGCFAATEGQ